MPSPPYSVRLIPRDNTAVTGIHLNLQMIEFSNRPANFTFILGLFMAHEQETNERRFSEWWSVDSAYQIVHAAG